MGSERVTFPHSEVVLSKHRTVIDAALAGAGLVRQSLDALYNAITGLGAGQSFGVELDQYVPYNALLTIYRQETYARRAVDLPVKDAWAKEAQKS